MYDTALNANEAIKTQCPLCKQVASEFYTEEFFVCGNCLGIFRHPDSLPNREQEKARYEYHNDDVFDTGHRSFVQPLTDTILSRFSPNDNGLDFGSGPSSVVSEILKEKNFSIKQYDPFFQNDFELLETTYDYIACCEVVEHFHNPAKDFQLLYKLLRPGASLLGMTHIYNPEIDFKTWYYKNDKTHVFFYQRETLEWIKLEFGFKNLEFRDKIFILER